MNYMSTYRFSNYNYLLVVAVFLALPTILNKKATRRHSGNKALFVLYVEPNNLLQQVNSCSHL